MASYYGWTRVDVSSYDAFRRAVLGNGYDVDNAYGFQCYDGAAVQFFSATGRHLSTGGTGAARGCWEVPSARSYNAGTEYELITDKTQIRRGDCLVWSMNNTWGHIGFADEDYHGDYIKVLGQNQAGNGGGYPFTVANISLATFLGAFRYKPWKPITPTVSGDTDGEKKHKVAKVVVPTGITIAALAAALGLSIPQLLAGDPNDPTDDLPADTPTDQPLDNDTAQHAAENATKAEEAVTGKTIDQLAQDKCATEATECVEVETVQWNGSNDGTIWSMCVNHSTLSPEECTAKAIEINKERLEINAAKHNVVQQGGHWIWESEVYTIPTK